MLRFPLGDDTLGLKTTVLNFPHFSTSDHWGFLQMWTDFVELIPMRPVPLDLKPVVT